MTWRQQAGNFDTPINPEYEQEARLVDQARAGSERAFSALLARYQQPVFRLIFYLVGDADEARELSRIALKHSLTRMPRVPAGYSVRPWLLRVATLVALDAVRERSETPQALIASLQLPTPQATPRIIDADPTLSETMELSITKLEENPEGVVADAWDRLPIDVERELVRRLLASLPENDAELLALGVVGQVPTRDLAAIAGTSQRSIRRRIARALILFQSHYQMVRQEALPPPPLTKELDPGSISAVTAINVARRGLNEATERMRRSWHNVRASLGSVDAQASLQTLRDDDAPAAQQSRPLTARDLPASQAAAATKGQVPPAPATPSRAPTTTAADTIILAAPAVTPPPAMPVTLAPTAAMSVPHTPPTVEDLAIAMKGMPLPTEQDDEPFVAPIVNAAEETAAQSGLWQASPDETSEPAQVDATMAEAVAPESSPTALRQLPRFGPPAESADGVGMPEDSAPFADVGTPSPLDIGQAAPAMEAARDHVDEPLVADEYPEATPVAEHAIMMPPATVANDATPPPEATERVAIGDSDSTTDQAVTDVYVAEADIASSVVTEYAEDETATDEAVGTADLEAAMSATPDIDAPEAVAATLPRDLSADTPPAIVAGVAETASVTSAPDDQAEPSVSVAEPILASADESQPLLADDAAVTLITMPSEDDGAIVAESISDTATPPLDVGAQAETRDSVSPVAAAEPVTSMPMAAANVSDDVATVATNAVTTEAVDAQDIDTPDAGANTTPRKAAPDPAAAETSAIASDDALSDSDLAPATMSTPAAASSAAAPAETDNNMVPTYEEAPTAEMAEVILPTVMRQEERTMPLSRHFGDTVVIRDDARLEYVARHQGASLDLSDLGGIIGVAFPEQDDAAEEAPPPARPPAAGVMHVAPASAATDEEYDAPLTQPDPDTTIVLKPIAQAPHAEMEATTRPSDLADLAGILSQMTQIRGQPADTTPLPPVTETKARRLTRPMPRLERDAPEPAGEEP